VPELPEVEFTAVHLRAWLVGHPIRALRAFPGTPLRDTTPAELARGLIGRRVERVERLGKQLFWHLSDGQVVLVHLGMTGKFLRPSLGDAPRRGTRLELDLATHRVDFVDPRRFGRLRLLPDEATARAHPEVARLGPDALVLAASPAAFTRRLGRTRQAIKTALMDQALLAGVGNIYAAEALYLARVDPFAPAAEVAPTALRRVAAALSRVMQESLARETADEIDYLSSSRRAAEANPFWVYGRVGEPCPRTGAPIERTEQAGRSTFWVPTWQAGRGLRRKSSAP
jgi:formamidopyrimidine-DNA glycosylase